jgi:DNA primase
MGKKNPLATMGKVSSAQLKLLRKFEALYLVRDMDEAGVSWTMTIGEACLPFFAPGKIWVATHYNGCKDPADVLRRRETIGQSQFVPFDEWCLDQAKLCN